MTNENSSTKLISSAQELSDMNLELMDITLFHHSDVYENALEYFDGDASSTGMAGTTLEKVAIRMWEAQIVEAFEQKHNVFLEDNDFVLDNWNSYFYD